MVDLLQRTLLEKAAVDAGFDVERPDEGAWLVRASTHAPLVVRLTPGDEGRLLAAVSQQNVARVLDSAVEDVAPPAGAWSVHAAADVPGLRRLLRRAFELSRSLPDELLHVFEQTTRRAPPTTEVERLHKERVGQTLFRQGLLDFWGGRCAMTGLAEPSLLRASHAKPWRDCASNKERLDVFNGLLLAPHLDALFDGGWLTVEDDGTVLFHERLTAGVRAALGVGDSLRVTGLRPEHRPYLAWHRGHEFGKLWRAAARPVPA